ncbi:MAG: DUF1844 domain-containing protein [Pirellulales bacterium]|nr:DUF1844 domain-containing protein [Pirellulales bacterium]
MSDDKKIIIDEDWKSQVEAEKNRLGEGASAAEESVPSSAGPDVPWPPASFELLVSTFATEAMVALGQLPSPVTNKAEFHAERARYAIDILGVLQDKTRGNLTPGEATGLEELLHQLRMAFVAMKQAPSA